MATSYIVGGEEAIPYSWPWQFGAYGHICGGSLVRNANGQMVVVTAAHCVDGSLGSAGSWTMMLGKHSLSSPEQSTSMSVKVTAINKHRRYSSNTMANDIAVMILADNTFADTDAVSPICLTDVDPAEYAGKDCVVTGWGTLESGGSSPDRLQQVYKPVLSMAQCSAAYGNAFDPTTMVCSGDLVNGGVDACQGDSGGPLACKSADGSWHLVGVVSWGYGCADARYPGVYANVHNYIDWLSANM
ncbi:hypothetical protein KUTeg_003646 [Tegillarca granosa]|uniref:Peptidase S1 domain-containing protein n=1 Tax=Tegillarca granosa TaxID=220873 RepID=A0ABQ9FS57_TEGGR|nr:hypothetical protein KUTeg_003646 [Tegillarca granosa]